MEDLEEKMIEDVRNRLNAYRDKNQDIDNQIERLERLEARIYGLGSQIVSDMPRSGSRSTDRMADMQSQKEELEAEIKEAVEEQAQERGFFENAMKSIRKADEKGVIRMRYFDGYEWEEVCLMIFGRKADYEGKEDTYLRRTFQLRKNAIKHIAEFMLGEQEIKALIQQI